MLLARAAFRLARHSVRQFEAIDAHLTKNIANCWVNNFTNRIFNYGETIALCTAIAVALR